MNTLFVGQNLMHLDTLESTNTFLMDFAKEKTLPEGTVVRVDHQSKGRGQQGQTWQTKAGQNLTFSLLLRPQFLAPEKQFLLSMAVALGVHDLLKRYKLDALVKWPNDIYTSKGKIAGILIENAWEGQRWKHAVIGIGLNVFQTSGWEGVQASSLALETHEVPDISSVLEALCSYLEGRYLQLKSNEKQILEEYHQVLMGVDRLLKYEDANGQFEALVKEVLPSGQMVLENKANHQLQTYWMKEVKILGMA